MRTGNKVRFALVLTAGLLASVATAGCSGGGHYTVVICVDSTKSTEDVRATYKNDMAAAAWDAAHRHANLYAAACGNRPGDSVDWPVRQEFEDEELSGPPEEEYLTGLVNGVMPRLEPLTETGSTRGTPLGEILAVEAQQCESASGGCSVYLFTDGEWADGRLRARGGVSRSEERSYVAYYGSEMGGLNGAKVYFVGAGLGTGMTTREIEEAQRVATSLVEAGEGEVAKWAKVLSPASFE